MSKILKPEYVMAAYNGSIGKIKDGRNWSKL
jgi:hypothetical protein